MKLVIAAIAMVAFTANAQAGWRYDVSHVRKGHTQIRVLSHGRGTVHVQSRGRSDTAPMVIRLPNRDDYVKVTIRAGGRLVVSRKFEVRRYQETVIHVRHTRRVHRHRHRRAASYIGRVINTSQWCKRSDHGTYRFDFLRNNRRMQSVIVNQARIQNNVTLYAGSYRVRVFQKSGKAGFIFRKTGSLNVTKDGWQYSYGCAKPKPRPRKRVRTFRFTLMNCTAYSARFVLRGLGTYNVRARSRWVGNIPANKRGRYRAQVYQYYASSGYRRYGRYGRRRARGVWRNMGVHIINVYPNGKTGWGCGRRRY